MSAVSIAFERIGRNHNVPPLRLDVDLSDPAAAAEAIATAVEKYRHKVGGIGSREVWAEVTLERSAIRRPAGADIGDGIIYCGGRNGGEFSITVVTAAVMGGAQ